MPEREPRRKTPQAVPPSMGDDVGMPAPPVAEEEVPTAEQDVIRGTHLSLAEARKEEDKKRHQAAREALKEDEKTKAEESKKNLERIFGAGFVAAIDARLQTLFQQRGIADDEINQKRSEFFSACTDALKQISIDQYTHRDRVALFLQVTGMTDQSGAYQESAIDQFLQRVLTRADLFPDATARTLFLQQGENFLEASIRDAREKLCFVFEPLVAEALMIEIERRAPQSPLGERLNFINGLLIVYRDELELLSLEKPLDRDQRMALAQHLGLAEPVSVSGELNMIGIARNVQYALEMGSIFSDKDEKALVRDTL